MTNRYAWAQRGDINAFFGLSLDNVAVMIFLLAGITSASPATDGCFSREFVFTQMIPGTALGVVVGDLIYTWLAFRLARRTGRSDVTAMPLGLDTPSTFAVGPLVLLPAVKIGISQYGLDHEQAMFFAWHVGAVLLVIIGIFKSAAAPLGTAVRSLAPRAGLLGSLAAIALVLIAFVPLWQHIAPVPLAGVAALIMLLIMLIGHHTLPGRIPGALAALVVGLGLYGVCHWLGAHWNVTLVPTPERQEVAAWRLPELFPEFARQWSWWRHVIAEAVSLLPVMLPFALATIVGGIDCTESAAAAGDDYDTRSMLWTEGIASVLAGLCGGVIQTTPYIGQPAYKAMGGRAAYTLATAVFIGLAGGLGWFAHMFEWLPEAVCFPILVYVGLEIGAQSFRATPTRHYAAVALAMLPALAVLATIPLDIATRGNWPPFPVFLALRCLSNGFIVTSLLWASALAAALDRHMYRAAAYLGAAAVCSLVGIIHSPLAPAVIGWPWDVYAQMRDVYGQLPQSREMLCQSPYHWAGGYVLAAVTVVVIGWISPRGGKNEAVAVETLTAAAEPI
jgi:adenine/guanine/hypoxanthine permease